NLSKTMPKPTQSFEFHLRCREELEWEHGTGDGGGIRVLRPRLDEPFEPGRVDGHIVVEIGDEVAARLAKAAIAGDIEADRRLADISHIRVAHDGLMRSLVR